MFIVPVHFAINIKQILVHANYYGIVLPPHDCISIGLDNSYYLSIYLSKGESI
jgi:hypothetical protein